MPAIRQPVKQASYLACEGSVCQPQERREGGKGEGEKEGKKEERPMTSICKSTGPQEPIKNKWKVTIETV